MQQEAADELISRDRHATGLLAISGPVILVLKSHLPVAESQNPLIGKGDPVRISAQIVENLGRPPERRFGIDDPVDVPKRLEQRAERRGVCQPGDGARELELLVAKRPFEGLEQESPEQGREHSDGKKEPGFARDPLGAIRADSASGNDAMEVGMKE